MLRSLEQKRANYAWKCIQKVKNLNKDNIEKSYNSYIKKTPTLIQTNGLGNSLAFYKSKFGSEKDEKLNTDKRAYKLLYEHINNWFKQKYQKHKDILDWIIHQNTSSTEVFQTTKEILAFLSWMKRFAEAELKEGEQGG